MRPAYELEVVPLHELVGDLLAEKPPSAPRTHRPCFHFLGIGPNQITESTWIKFVVFINIELLSQNWRSKVE